MTDLPPLPRPSQLWKQLSADRKLQAADAFWRDQHAGAEQAEAVAAIAARIKFRAKSVIGMPIEKRARQLATMSPVSELLAARLLVAYHLAQQRPMMAAFLDSLGITHDEGLIADEDLKAPEPEALKSAAAALSNAFPQEDVSLYLTTLVWQDPDTWGALSDALQSSIPV